MNINLCGLRYILFGTVAIVYLCFCQPGEVLSLNSSTFVLSLDFSILTRTFVLRRDTLGMVAG